VAVQRDELRTAIVEQAYDEKRGVYAGAFGSDHLDASVLLMPMMGLAATDDERMLATIHAIDRELGVDVGLITAAWAIDEATQREETHT